MKKIIRITTVPKSLGGLLHGQLKYMSDHYEVIGISSNANGGLDQVGVQEKTRVIPVEMTRKITPVEDLKAVWRLYKIFRQEKPFIVHTHTPKAGTLGMLAAFLAKVPHRLHTIAGLPLLETKGNKRRLLNMVEKLTYKCATKIYPNSFGLESIVLENKFTTDEKLKVIGNGSSNGIDTNRFDPNLYSVSDKEKIRMSIGIKKNDFVYVFVGRIVKDKGINELVKAFKKVSSELKDTKLLLVGGYEEILDPVSPETKNIIDTHSNILFMGWQKDVRPYFAVSNVLTFPSYREGFPNVVMQAGAMGLPSIVSNINGCNEIIIEGDNGFIVPVKNDEKLYYAMQQAYKKNQNKINFDKTHIRELIKKRYSREIIWKEILKEYKSL